VIIGPDLKHWTFDYQTQYMSKTTQRLKWLTATCGGFGYSPILPGTMGALWGIGIYIVIAVWVVEPWQTAAIAGALLVSCVATLMLSDWAEAFFGEEDSGRFVTDEVVGFLAVVLLFRLPNPWWTVLWVFPLIRVIDIIKVPPARRLEHLPGGWGVIADDLLAAAYTVALLHTLRWFQPTWFGP
jgi:phosphatidylglycerophosphatase A